MGTFSFFQEAIREGHHGQEVSSDVSRLLQVNPLQLRIATARSLNSGSRQPADPTNQLIYPSELIQQVS
jgi:hypothetical protein